MRIVEFDRCHECGSSILIDLVDQKKRCASCRNEWATAPKVDDVPTLFTDALEVA